MSASATKSRKRGNSDSSEAQKKKRVKPEKDVSSSSASGDSEDEFTVNIIEAPSANEVSATASLTAADDSEACTVYVEGIPYSCSEDDVKSFFSKCGAVLEVRMPRYQDSGKPMGYAHVEFATAKAAAAAVGRSGEHLGSRYLTIQFAAQAKDPKPSQPAKRPRGCTTLFVKNLPYECTEDEVEAAFKKFGGVQSVRLARWNQTKKLKGFGYVQFEDGKDAEAAVRSKITLKGRVLATDYETTGPKRSFRTTTGQYWHKVNKSTEKA